MINPSALNQNKSSNNLDQSILINSSNKKKKLQVPGLEFSEKHQQCCKDFVDKQIPYLAINRHPSNLNNIGLMSDRTHETNFLQKKIENLQAIKFSDNNNNELEGNNPTLYDKSLTMYSKNHQKKLSGDYDTID